MIKYPTKPRLTKSGYLRIGVAPYKRVLLHRYLLEKHIGRNLKKGEIVHHKDGNPLNNLISNLELMSQAEHLKIHKPKKVLIDWSKYEPKLLDKSRVSRIKGKYNWKNNPNKKLTCLVCSSAEINSRSLCNRHYVSWHRNARK